MFLQIHWRIRLLASEEELRRAPTPPIPEWHAGRRRSFGVVPVVLSLETDKHPADGGRRVRRPGSSLRFSQLSGGGSLCWHRICGVRFSGR